MSRLAPECPCIDNSSAVYEQLRNEVEARGLPADYGTQGCKAYDAASCGDNARDCASQWCYVDMTLCPLNADLCEAEGGLRGSDSSPHCRSRPHDITALLNLSVYFSFETCGFVNLYDVKRHSASAGGYQLRAVVDPFPPWVLERNSTLGVLEYYGTSFDFFQEALNLFEPPAALQLLPGWATQKSRQLFRSSYTACVHDVAVGSFDVCIADLWLTPARHRLASFMPPIRQDLFYLVVPRKFEEVTLMSYLQRPFLPFTIDAWMGVFAFLCGMSVVLWVVKIWETPSSDRGGCKWSLEEFGVFLFGIWHDFLLGQSSHDVERGPTHKLFSLGFSFFILVTLASYTASLASMLVVQREASGEINSMADAEKAGIAVCAPAVLSETFSSLYTQATFQDCEGIEDCPRLLHAGRCGAMIASLDVIDSMHAGKIKQQDCDAVNSGAISEEVGRCSTNHLGQPRDDCDLLRVGDLIWSVPLSFPISDRLAHSMSWAVTRALSDGMFEAAKESGPNKAAFPVTQCTHTEDRSETDGLNLADLTGTIFISVFFVSFGLVCFVIEVMRRDGRRGIELVRRSTQSLIGHEPEAVAIGCDAEEETQLAPEPGPDPAPIVEPRESTSQASPFVEVADTRVGI
ncbi:GLR2.2 [Symbiodinium natans]|uniref:GLR2.2 protein n=1 Tax=Symbiodinium natans TaxID=878477 RepID=A0A812JNR2_9DINO|nr:GLR2.2 [Symbiodinium natans]